MKRERLHITWDEFAALKALGTETPTEHQLTDVLGSWMVDRMKRWADEEPIVFVFTADEKVRRELEVTLPAEMGED